MLAHGFARVRCESCKDEFLIALSCKGRGVYPSCNAKHAQVTAVHPVERVLPHVPYRQWTLSFPHRVRWVLLKEAGLFSDVLALFLQAVFAPHVLSQSSRGRTGPLLAPGAREPGGADQASCQRMDLMLGLSEVKYRKWLFCLLLMMSSEYSSPVMSVK
ncbi:MAG: transposase zinc-binding domain-containing protein [Myxococcaceae bacterium]|nr:transposase zinc-binding domain-containing protein [Myxococcaceae bacterium]